MDSGPCQAAGRGARENRAPPNAALSLRRSPGRHIRSATLSPSRVGFLRMTRIRRCRHTIPSPYTYRDPLLEIFPIIQHVGALKGLVSGGLATARVPVRKPRPRESYLGTPRAVAGAWQEED